MHGRVGHRQRGVAPEETLGLEGAQQLGALGRHSAEQRGDVDLDEDEADLALGSIQVERAPQHHHHPLGELDALLGQVVAQRRPRAAPALDLERGLAAPGPWTRRRLVPGVHQVQVEMARPVVREVLDLAAHPQRAVPWQGAAQRTLDLVVEAADGEDPAAPAGLGPGGGVGAAGIGPVDRVGGLLRGGQRQGLGIEELMGTTGHRRHPTEALCGSPSPGVAHWRRR